jgi:hypothetical protein
MRTHADKRGPLQLLRMTEGLIIHQSLCAAAGFGIADLLRDGPRDIAEMAATVRANEQALYRLLRFLTGHGAFCETAPRRFGQPQCQRARG